MRPSHTASTTGNRARRRYRFAIGIAASVVILTGCSVSTDGQATGAIATPETAMPAGTPSSSPSPAAADGEGICTISAIANDVGRQPIEPPRCSPGWAYVSWALQGDAQSLLRVVDGQWQIYTSFPSKTCVDEARADGVPQRELSSFIECRPSQTSQPAELSESGDLGLATPITRPDCDGLGIVVLHSAITPGDYAAEVSRALGSNPGASYLRTDQSCPSLNQRSSSGTPIYAVFRPAGRTSSEVCAAVRREGGDAYGKWLDTTSDPSQIIAC